MHTCTSHQLKRRSTNDIRFTIWWLIWKQLWHGSSLEYGCLQFLRDRKLVMRLHIHTLVVLLMLALSCHFFFFKSPHFQQTCFCFCSFLSPSISRYLYADPLHCNMTYLFLRLLKDDLKEYTYAARLAGLVYGVASGMNAILVSKPFEINEGSTLRLWHSVEMAWFSMLRLVMWSAVCPVCPTFLDKQDQLDQFIKISACCYSP